MIDLDGFADLVNELRSRAGAKARIAAGRTGKRAAAAEIHAELGVLPALALQLASGATRGQVVNALAAVAIGSGACDETDLADFIARADRRLFATPVNPNPPVCEL